MLRLTCELRLHITGWPASTILRPESLNAHCKYYAEWLGSPLWD